MPLGSLSRIRLVLPVALLALAGCESSSLTQLGAPVGAAAGKGSSADRLMTMGEDAMRAGEPQTAALLFQRAMAGSKGDPRPATRLGDALLAEGKVQDALDAYRAALRIDTYDPDATRGYARAMIALNRPDAAAVQVEAVIDRMPNDPKLLTTLGVVLDMLGRHEQAQRRYRQALATAPDDPATVNDLALSQALSGEFDAAIATLRPLAERPSASARSRQNLAVIYALMGNDSAAERLFRIDLSDADVRANMAYFGQLRGLGSSAKAAQLLAHRSAVIAPAVTMGVAPPSSPERPALAPRKAPPVTAEPDAVAPGHDPVPLVPPQADAALESAADPAPTPGDSDLVALEATDVPAPPTVPPPFGVSAASAVALEESEIRDGRSPLGDWVADLGSFPSPVAAEAHWQAVRQADPQLAAGLLHLASSGDGPQPLLVGPFASEDVARSFCGMLAAKAKASCRPLRL